MAQVGFEQGDSLIEDIGAGGQWGCQSVDELSGSRVVSLTVVYISIPGTGVRKDKKERAWGYFLR